MMDIKETYTITEEGATSFNRKLKTIINDLQSDGLEVEVKFSTTVIYDGYIKYSAVIIGRGK